MPEPLEPALQALRAEILDAERLVRAVASGRRRGAAPPWRRVELRWVDLHDGRRLQAVGYDDRQAHTRNLSTSEAPDELDSLLAGPFGSWHVESVGCTTQLRVTKRGEAQVHRSTGAAPGRAADRAVDRAHDRVKPRLLDPADPFLVAVGISDADGTLKPSRRDKYRQVEQFLRTLEPVLPRARAAAGDGPLRVADLGCGNAYLTFAAYRRLAQPAASAGGPDEPAPPRVELVGVDVRALARERNTALATSLGAGGAVFVEGSIADVELERPPHLVLALHACDTATDEALARAVRWRAPVVLAAPCCHHDLQRQLDARGAPEPYPLVTRHGILRERLADVLTDALRAALLRIAGYRVDVVEFVDSQHTPRNVALRAVWTGTAPGPEVVREYRELTSDWGVTPALHRMLEPELGLAVDPA